MAGLRKFRGLNTWFCSLGGEVDTRTKVRGLCRLFSFLSRQSRAGQKLQPPSKLLLRFAQEDGGRKVGGGIAGESGDEEEREGATCVAAAIQDPVTRRSALSGVSCSFPDVGNGARSFHPHETILLSLSQYEVKSFFLAPHLP
jgi:hypothetical protein